jgi:hypothetical protein
MAFYHDKSLYWLSPYSQGGTYGMSASCVDIFEEIECPSKLLLPSSIE